RRPRGSRGAWRAASSPLRTRRELAPDLVEDARRLTRAEEDVKPRAQRVEQALEGCAVEIGSLQAELPAVHFERCARHALPEIRDEDPRNDLEWVARTVIRHALSHDISTSRRGTILAFARRAHHGPRAARRREGRLRAVVVHGARVALVGAL